MLTLRRKFSKVPLLGVGDAAVKYRLYFLQDYRSFGKLPEPYSNILAIFPVSHLNQV